MLNSLETFCSAVFIHRLISTKAKLSSILFSFKRRVTCHTVCGKFDEKVTYREGGCLIFTVPVTSFMTLLAVILIFNESHVGLHYGLSFKHIMFHSLENWKIQRNLSRRGLKLCQKSQNVY
jgi:hypothetical protein